MELKVDVKKRYGGFSLETGFTVAGERIGVFGASGSGKSTLVGMIAGLNNPDEGEIYLDGECLFSAEKRINVPPEKRRLALVFQNPCLFPHLSVRSNLLYGLKRRKSGERSVDFERLIGALRLESLLERGVNNLSGGEKQRVALGRAILSNPRLLLMDESLSALDEALKLDIIHYLKDVCGMFRIPYLFISHSLLEVRLLVSRVLVLSSGRLTGQTTPEELARNRMGESQVGYINLLELAALRQKEGLYAYRWGGNTLFLSAGNDRPEAMFELSSRDIILFNKHPDAVSARNLLRCTVLETFPSGNKIGVELSCGGERLVAEVVVQAARELAIEKGCELYAVVKASSFRRLG